MGQKIQASGSPCSPQAGAEPRHPILTRGVGAICLTRGRSLLCLILPCWLCCAAQFCPAMWGVGAAFRHAVDPPTLILSPMTQGSPSLPCPPSPGDPLALPSTPETPHCDPAPGQGAPITPPPGTPLSLPVLPRPIPPNPWDPPSPMSRAVTPRPLTPALRGHRALSCIIAAAAILLLPEHAAALLAGCHRGTGMDLPFAVLGGAGSASCSPPTSPGNAAKSLQRGRGSNDAEWCLHGEHTGTTPHQGHIQLPCRPHLHPLPWDPCGSWIWAPCPSPL